MHIGTRMEARETQYVPRALKAVRACVHAPELYVQLWFVVASREAWVAALRGDLPDLSGEERCDQLKARCQKLFNDWDKVLPLPAP